MWLSTLQWGISWSIPDPGTCVGSGGGGEAEGGRQFVVRGMQKACSHIDVTLSPSPFLALFKKSIKQSLKKNPQKPCMWLCSANYSYCFCCDPFFTPLPVVSPNSSFHFIMPTKQLGISSTRTPGGVAIWRNIYISALPLLSILLIEIWHNHSGRRDRAVWMFVADRDVCMRVTGDEKMIKQLVRSKGKDWENFLHILTCW